MATKPIILCSNQSTAKNQAYIYENPIAKHILFGNLLKTAYNQNIGIVKREMSSLLPDELYLRQMNGHQIYDKGMINELFEGHGTTQIELPDPLRLVTDCAKLKQLDVLLDRLKAEGHRSLIFCQVII